MRTSALSHPSTTVARDPWPQLEKAGLVVRWADKSEPLEKCVDESALQGLDALVERVIDAGGQFERSHGWIESKLKGAEYTALSAAEAKARIRQQPLISRQDLFVSIDGQEHLPVYSLVDLRALDLAYGLKAASASTYAPVAQALQTLREHGWTFQCDNYHSHFQNTSGPYSALAALSPGDAAVRVTAPTGGAQARAQYVSDGRDLISLAFFESSGTVDGLADPSLAMAVRTLAQRGYEFASSERHDFTYAPWVAHRVLTRGSKDTMRIGRPGQLKVQVGRSELDDLPALERRIAEGESLYAQHGAPLLKWEDTSVFPHHWVSAVLDPETCRPLNAGQRAELLGAIMAAYKTERSDSFWEAFRDSVEDMRALGARLSDPALLRSEALWLAELRGHCPPGADGREETFGRLRDRFHMEAGSPQRYAELQGHLVRLAAATHDITAAREQLEFMLIPMGDLSIGDRITAFEQIAQAAEGRFRKDAAQNLQCVLGHRLPHQTLEASVTRFVEIVAALDVAGKGERAREVFTVLQESCKGADAAVADERWSGFCVNLALTRDVEQALQSALQAPSQEKGAQGGVHVDTGGGVTIGKVRIPVRAASATEAERSASEAKAPLGIG